MNLIERYLHAVEFWLPKHQKQDILEELTEDIHSQMEERQAALGRDLNEDETVALLKERGRPVMVANRFQPQRYLIGPALFPIYLFVLRVVGFFYVVPGFVVSAVIYHTQHGKMSWPTTLSVAGGSVWAAALTMVGVVTLIFAGLQASGFAERELQNWNPRQLPTVKDRNQRSRSATVVDIVANTVFLLWWIPCFSSVEILRGPGILLTLNPVWRYIYWGFLATGIFKIGLSVANLLQPHWTRGRAGLWLAINLGGSLLFWWMMRAHVIAFLWIASLGTEKSALLAHTMDHYAVTVIAPIVLTITAVLFMVDLMRVLRAAEKRPPRVTFSVRGSLSA